MDSPKGPEWFATILQALHVPAPHLMAWLTILVELIGGGAVLTGAVIRLASIPMVTVLLVAMFSVHLHHGFSSIKLMGITPTGTRLGPAGTEPDLLYIACLVALVLGGSGPFAIDNLFAVVRKKQNNLSQASQTRFPSLRAALVGCDYCWAFDVHHIFAKNGEFWLRETNRSESKIRLAAPRYTRFDYGTYQFEDPNEITSAEATEMAAHKPLMDVR